ncbi:hypothetical protein ACWEWU_14635 [Staphylococcus xylosus]
MTESTKKKIYNFGMADFIFDEGKPTELKFDGKLCDKNSFVQAEGGQVSLEPELEDITIADFGNGNFDQSIVGWNGTVTIVGARTTLEMISRTLSGTVSLKENGELVTVTDAPIGSSLREESRTLRIHPRDMGGDLSEDIYIHKIANTSGMSRPFGNEQGNYEMEFNMFLKDCADANSPNNYFYIGKDPDKIKNTEEGTPS